MGSFGEDLKDLWRNTVRKSLQGFHQFRDGRRGFTGKIPTNPFIARFVDTLNIQALERISFPNRLFVFLITAFVADSNGYQIFAAVFIADKKKIKSDWALVRVLWQDASGDDKHLAGRCPSHLVRWKRAADSKWISQQTRAEMFPVDVRISSFQKSFPKTFSTIFIKTTSTESAGGCFFIARPIALVS